MDLFIKDIFSAREPDFHQVDSETSDYVLNLLAGEYSYIDCRNASVLQNQGNEVNASNFKIETPSHAYLMKKFIKLKSAEFLNSIINLTNWLREESVPLPQILSTDRGAFFFLDNDGLIWCLFEFKTGHYFTGGSIRETQSVARAVGRMARASISCPRKLQLTKFVDRYNEYEAIFGELKANKSALDRLFGEELGVAIRSNWKGIEKAYELVMGYRDKYHETQKTPMHMDLHPHNILVSDSELSSFLDIDSFAMEHVFIPVAFGIQKLVRHAIAGNSESERSKSINMMPEVFVDAVESEFPELAAERGNLYLFAVMDIYRRLNTIFALNLRSQNRSWNHVLLIQLRSLAEAEIIFEKAP